MSDIAYNPQTDHGRGFLPLLTRVTQFVTLIIGAIGYEWPITVEIARGNIDRAIQRSKDITITEAILSPDANKALANWQAQAQALSDILKKEEQKKADSPLTTEHKELLKAFVNQTWALTALLDRELLGLTTDETDPGREP